MIDKKAWKYAFYYGTRFQAWSFLLAIVAGLIKGFLDPIVSYSIFTNCVFEIVFGIYITKLALEKSIFNKYKHFELNPNSDISPKFGKINWKAMIKLYIILSASVFLLFAVIFGIYSLIYSDFKSIFGNLVIFFSGQAGKLNSTEINEILKVIGMCFILGYFLNIAILKWFVSKNATITPKNKKPDIILEICH